MIRKIVKTLLNLIIFIAGSFVFDLVLHYIIKIKMSRILFVHGTLYFAYGAISLLSFFIFDSASTYAKLHEKENLFPLPKKVKNTDIIFSLIGGLSLIALEAIYH